MRALLVLNINNLNTGTVRIRIQPILNATINETTMLAILRPL